MMTGQTDQEILVDLGARLKALRLQRNITIAEISARGGLNPNTVVNAEAGHDPRLSTVVKLLRSLDRLEALESFLPPPGISPLQLADLQGKIRHRARKVTHG